MLCFVSRENETTNNSPRIPAIIQRQIPRQTQRLGVQIRVSDKQGLYVHDFNEFRRFQGCWASQWIVIFGCSFLASCLHLSCFVCALSVRIFWTYIEVFFLSLADVSVSFYFFCLGEVFRRRGSSRRQEGGGSSFILKIPGGGGSPRRGGRGSRGLEGTCGNLGGGGGKGFFFFSGAENNFFRGRNSHQITIGVFVLEVGAFLSAPAEGEQQQQLKTTFLM